MAAWGYEFYLLVLKVSLTREHSKIKFASPRGHVISSLYICYTDMLYIKRYRIIYIMCKFMSIPHKQELGYHYFGLRDGNLNNPIFKSSNARALLRGNVEISSWLAHKVSCLFKITVLWCHCCRTVSNVNITILALRRSNDYKLPWCAECCSYLSTTLIANIFICKREKNKLCSCGFQMLWPLYFPWEYLLINTKWIIIEKWRVSKLGKRNLNDFNSLVN